MALNVKKGVLTAPAGTGNQTYTLPTGFDPKVVLLWATYETADALADGDGIFALGACTYDGAAVQQWRLLHFDDDAVNSAVTVNGLNSTACLAAVTADGTTLDYEASLVSFASDNFILNWTNVPASQILVHYLALGGSDISAARCGFTTLTAAVATQDITVNAGFGQPDLMLFGAHGWNATGEVANDSRIMLGAAKSDTERRCALYAADDGSGNMALGSWHKDRALLFFGSTIVADGEADLSAKASWPADGYQINWIDQISFAFRLGWVALKGTFTASLGANTAPSGTPPINQDLALASGTPKGAILWGTHIPANASIDSTHADLGGFWMGAMDGTDEGSAATVQDDGNTASRTGRDFSSTKIVRHIVADAAGGAPTLQSEADSSFSGSNVRVAWTDTDATAREYSYLLLGEPGGAAPTSLPFRRHPSRGILLR